MSKVYDSHPLIVTRRLKERYGARGMVFEYSKYLYQQPGTTVYRVTYKEEAENIGTDWLACILAGLRNDEELGWHSRVKISGDTYHIPMVDFLGLHVPVDVIKKVAGITKTISSATSRLYLFKSGRSFHGYFDTLLDSKEWDEYLGELLLLNSSEPKRVQHIDWRWVGHSLKLQTSVLRWSQNSERHDQMPQLVGVER